MNYRQKLYSQYVSKHTSCVYGQADTKKIESKFPAWNQYYGKHLPQNRAAKILEIGCGNGGFLLYLQSLGYRDCFGVDICDEQIGVARDLGIKNVETADLEDFLQAREDCYDLIVARDVLEHFAKEEVLRILEAIHRSLTTFGRFIMQSPNAESPFSGRYRYGDFTHEIAFTATSLSQILGAAGFKKTQMYPTAPAVHGLKSAIRLMLWKLIEAGLSFCVLVETGSAKGIFTQNLICVASK